MRDLADGMCLVLKMTNEVELRKILRSLTLRLLLSYPPTTLNVALFDPMRNGETFAGLRGIVDLAHENVLPEVVVSGAELGRRRLQSLRLRMAQHIGNYSDPLADGFFATSPPRPSSSTTSRTASTLRLSQSSPRSCRAGPSSGPSSFSP